MMSLWASSALLVCGLGIVPLMLSASQALRSQRDSLALGQAVLLAQDLAHRLQLNASAATQYQLDWGGHASSTTNSTPCQDRPCSRAEWAQADVTQWRAQVGQTLPDADAWLQATGSEDASRWLVLAWSSDAVLGSAASRLPVACPTGKRCQAWVLSP
jgi:type IV pilus assembly protein PilV